MVTKIQNNSQADYRLSLAKLITDKIVNQNKMITFVDCHNHISQYIFERIHLEKIMDNLFLTRIEQIFDLLDILKSIQFNSYFQKSSVFLISSYQHLFNDLDNQEKVFFSVGCGSPCRETNLYGKRLFPY